MKNRQSFKSNQGDRNKTNHVQQYIHHNTKKHQIIYFNFLISKFQFHPIVQKVSSHFEQHCRANFSYRRSEGRTCVMLPKGLLSKSLEIRIPNECKDSKYGRTIPSK